MITPLIYQESVNMNDFLCVYLRVFPLKNPRIKYPPEMMDKNIVHNKKHYFSAGKVGIPSSNNRIR
jgi:hypothetical protein